MRLSRLHFVALRGSTCCAKTWSTNAATDVILMAHRRRDQRPRESDCHLREVLLTSMRNDQTLYCGGRRSRCRERNVQYAFGVLHRRGCRAIRSSRGGAHYGHKADRR
jgi:hypothetical protein